MPENWIGLLSLPLALMCLSGVSMTACVFGAPACSGTFEGLVLFLLFSDCQNPLK
jgi:hypothetical protein